MLIGCGGDDSADDGVFEHDDFPFTFRYPDGFHEDDDVTIDIAAGGEPVAMTAVALDERSGVVLERFALNTAINDSNLDQVRDELDRLMQGIAPGESSRTTSVAGLPAITYEDVPIRTIEGARSRLVAIFDGDDEYFFNCQSLPETRSQVEEACDLALATLELG